MSQLNSDALNAAHIAFASGGVSGAVAAYLAALPKQESEVSKLTAFLNTISVGRPTKEVEACETAIMLIKHLRQSKQEPDCNPVVSDSYKFTEGQESPYIMQSKRDESKIEQVSSPPGRPAQAGV